jgi:hypothetical protein
MKTRNTEMALALSVLLMGGWAHADTTPGVWNAAFRYRSESVDDDAFAKGADAHTARLRLGYRQPFATGFSVFVEGEGVAEINDDFNSTANRQTAFPAVPDARALELNQAYVAWQPAGTNVLLGRQRLNLDNQRFIGAAAWRQNEQTFDALNIDRKIAEQWTLRYLYLDRVHRVNGDEAIDPLARERELADHLLGATYTQGTHTFTGYGYFHDDQDVASASTRTIGLRWLGKYLPGDANDWIWGWTVEYAKQADYADNPQNFSLRYFLIEPSVSLGTLTARVGLENLGGNGNRAVQTPLATLHAFNGWADKFLVTPNAGLADRYLGLTDKFGTGAWQDKFTWNLMYHDYRADRGSADFGRELNFSLAAALPSGWAGMIKLADYRSDGFARDTRKIWLQFEWLFH